MQQAGQQQRYENGKHVHPDELAFEESLHFRNTYSKWVDRAQRFVGPNSNVNHNVNYASVNHYNNGAGSQEAIYKSAGVRGDGWNGGECQPHPAYVYSHNFMGALPDKGQMAVKEPIGVFDGETNGANGANNGVKSAIAAEQQTVVKDYLAKGGTLPKEASVKKSPSKSNLVSDCDCRASPKMPPCNPQRAPLPVPPRQPDYSEDLAADSEYPANNGLWDTEHSTLRKGLGTIHEYSQVKGNISF